MSIDLWLLPNYPVIFRECLPKLTCKMIFINVLYVNVSSLLKCCSLTQMCCRSLLLTGCITQFVPTSFTAHSMSMLVTTPHWLSCDATNTNLAHLFINYHSCFGIQPINRVLSTVYDLFNVLAVNKHHCWWCMNRTGSEFHQKKISKF